MGQHWLMGEISLAYKVYTNTTSNPINGAN